MNYLGHLLLADGTPESVLGNFLGDFVKGRPEGRYPQAVVAGIRLHRRIDCFTDEHEGVRRAMARIDASRRRYAGIAVDMAFDHFLARDWEADDPAGFADFRRSVYDLLLAHAGAMPERARRMLPSFTGDDWLAGYADFDGVCFALERMSRRLSRPNRLAETSGDIAAAYDELAADLEAFWPDVRAYAEAEGRRLQWASRPNGRD